MHRALFLRTSAELLEELRILLNDVAETRWTDDVLLRSINRALREWHGRVAIPHRLAQTFTLGTLTYALPDYAIGPVDVVVQHYLYPNTYPSTGDLQEEYALGARIEVTASGARQVRLNAPVEGVGALIWWAAPSMIPLTAMTLGGDIDDDDTTLTTSTFWDADPSGYLKIENEFLAYAGIAHAAVSTLSNLSRAVNFTTASAHTTGTTIDWCVPADDHSLYEQLLNRAAEFAHRTALQDGAGVETEHHERMMLDARMMADRFWGEYVPARPAIMQLRGSRGRYL